MKSSMDTKAKALGCVLAAVTLVVGFSGSRCFADLYSGSISWSSTASEIFATGNWADPATSIAWKVTNMGTHIHYEYTLTVATGARDLSHFIIEVSDSFTDDDIDENTASHPYDLQSYSSAGPGGSNPDMPSTIYGLKFEDFDEDESPTWTWSFDSSRLPTWGDCYAVNGKTPNKEVYLYNSGFLVEPDVELNHIAVPDTVVPVPGAVLLGILGLGAAGVKLRRFV